MTRYEPRRKFNKPTWAFLPCGSFANLSGRTADANKKGEEKKNTRRMVTANTMDNDSIGGTADAKS